MEDQFQGWWWWRQWTKVRAVMWSAFLIPNEGYIHCGHNLGKLLDTGFLSAYKISNFHVRLKHSLTSSEEDEETFLPPKVLFFYLLVSGILPLRCFWYKFISRFVIFLCLLTLCSLSKITCCQFCFWDLNKEFPIVKPTSLSEEWPNLVILPF